MPKVLVLGSSGQLASEIRRRHEEDADFIFVGKERLGERDTLSKLMSEIRPESVINCCAYTAVDKAESEPEACFDLNVRFVKNLGELSQDFNFHLVHFSTEYVFDGRSPTPYVEEDVTAPLNVYGRSKREGELALFEVARSATIVRTSWVYSEFGHNFVKTVLRLGKGKDELKVVNDQLGCPTWAGDLAEFATGPCLLRSEKVNLVHFSGGGQTSWCDFAQMTLDMTGIKKQVIPISTQDYPTPAQRPRYGVMSKNRVKRMFGVDVRPWDESLNECLRLWGLV